MAGVLLLIVTAGGAALSPALGLPFIADDIDLLHSTAQMREGTLPLPAYLALNHNEHRIPVMRGLVLAATALGNLDASLFRAAVLVVHLCCAVLVALMVRHTLGLSCALLAGALFAAPGSFSLMVVWAPTSAVFSLSLLFILLTRHALADGRYPHPGWASFYLLGATLSLNGSVVTVPSLLVGYWHRLGTTGFRRALVSGCWLIGAVAVFRWSSAAFVAPAVGVDANDLVAATRNAGFLVLSAPARWMLAWANMPPGYMPDASMMVLTGAGLGIMAMAVPAPLRRPVLVLLTSAIALSAAVAYGRRGEGIATIYETDRYYYAFGAPFAAITASGARWLLTLLGNRRLVLGTVAVSLPLVTFVTNREVLRVVEAPWIQAHRQGLAEARLLAASFAHEAARRSLVAPDGFIPLAGLPKGGMSLLAIVRGVYPAGVPGLTLGSAGTDDDRVNAVLNEWSRRVGNPVTPIVAEGGRLRPVEVFGVDFSVGPFNERVGDGFHAWASTMGARWLSRRGRVTFPYSGQRSLAIEADLPGQLLRAAGVLGEADSLKVTVNGTPLGTISFWRRDHVRQSFELPSISTGQLEVEIESTFVWMARQIYPENLDPRELSVSIRSILLKE